MSEVIRLCSRPHSSTVDFATARFVVATSRGLDISEKHLEYGDVVPEGALDPNALRQEYEPPLRRIELLDFVIQSYPELYQAYQNRNLASENPSEIPELEQMRPANQYDGMTRKQLEALCRIHSINTSGNAADLRRRLRAKLG